jgi:hypothetical protein
MAIPVTHPDADRELPTATTHEEEVGR